MKTRNSYLVLVTLFLLISANLFAEKWVGQAATYQLRGNAEIADGTTFNKDGMNAACNGFKLGTKVHIYCSKTGKSADITINDRVSPQSNYFILLTPAVANALDILWETAVVVVEGSFNDIDSEQVNNVNGLVSENEVDPDNLTEFPKIDWPDESDNEFSDGETDIPDFVRDLLEEDETFDEEQHSKEPTADEPIVQENVPTKTDEEQNATKIQNELDESEILIPDEEDEEEVIYIDADEEEPTTEENVPNPENASTFIDLMEDEKLTVDRPLVENVPVPNQSKDIIITDDTDAHILPVIYPTDDVTNDAQNIYDIISEDDELVELLPNLIESTDDITPTLDLSTNLISEDDLVAEVYNLLPANEEMSTPESTDNRVCDDNETNDLIRANSDDDIQSEQSPTTDNTEEFYEVEDEYLETLSELEENKIYVRFMTTYDMLEARRMLNNFKNIVGDVCVLYQDDKYILLCGPYSKDSDEAFQALSDLQTMGFSDAYLLTK